MLCRYDTMALKSLDIFSVHGFPVGLVECESNILGIVNDDGPTLALVAGPTSSTSTQKPNFIATHRSRFSIRWAQGQSAD